MQYAPDELQIGDELERMKIGQTVVFTGDVSVVRESEHIYLIGGDRLTFMEAFDRTVKAYREEIQRYKGGTL